MPARVELDEWAGDTDVEVVLPMLEPDPPVPLEVERERTRRFERRRRVTQPYVFATSRVVVAVGGGQP